MQRFYPGVRSKQASPEGFSSRAGTGDSRKLIYSCQTVLIMMIVKDSTCPWRFSDGESKLKAPNLLAVRVLRDTRQIFAQCSKEKALGHQPSQVLWGFVLPVREQNLCSGPDGLFNEMFL